MNRVSSIESKTVDTRAAIIGVAEKQFRTLGYHKTTVADIAAELHMSPANIYRFFKSKQAINEALAAHMLQEVETQLEKYITSARPAAKRLMDFIQTLHSLTEQRYMTDHKLHDMVVAALTESWSVVEKHVERICGMIATIIADGIAKGEFPPQNVEAAALCIHAALAPFTHPVLMSQCRASHGAEAMKAQADLVGEFCLLALRNGFHPSPKLAKQGLGCRESST